MALIRSSLLSDISGSIGGTTYSRARGGAYARNRSVPINPKTALQEANRDLFSSISTQWGTLTGPQIDAWNVSAHAYPQLNRLGETYYPSGRQFFMMCNRNLSLISQPVQVDAPPPDALPALPVGVPSVQITVDTFTIDEFTVGVLSDGDGNTALKAVFKMTPPMAISRGQSYRNLLRGPYNGIANYVYPTGASSNVKTAYESRYSTGTDVPAAVGQVVNFAYRYIDAKYGLASAWLNGNSVLIAA